MVCFLRPPFKHGVCAQAFASFPPLRTVHATFVANLYTRAVYKFCRLLRICVRELAAQGRKEGPSFLFFFRAREELSRIFSKVIRARRASGAREDDILQCFIDSRYEKARHHL